MPDEFEGDLAGAVFWGADLTGARMRDVNLSDVTISHAWLVHVDIDAFVDGVVINGVDVTQYVNERDPWHPLRAMIRAADRAGMRDAWVALEDAWATTVALARTLSDDQLHEPVDGEWSFVKTLRHLVFVVDKWFTVPVGAGRFDPIGVPNTGSIDFPWPGIDAGLAPSIDEVLAVRADRAALVRGYLASLAAADLERRVDVLENGMHQVRECIWTVFEEAFWHNRYARRDLARLGASG